MPERTPPPLPPASPTTAIPGSASIIAFSPRRTIAWSSTTNTRNSVIVGTFISDISI